MLSQVGSEKELLNKSDLQVSWPKDASADTFHLQACEYITGGQHANCAGVSSGWYLTNRKAVTF